jgi:hypothetical protein
MGFLFGENKTWSNYFNGLGKTISKGTTDAYNSATKMATDGADAAKQSINSTTGYKVGGRRGTRKRRGNKPRRKMSRRNSKSMSRRN